MMRGSIRRTSDPNVIPTKKSPTMPWPSLVAAISQVRYPTIEVHISNPIRRGPASQTAAVSQGVVAGFGIAGYALALRGLKDLLASKK